MVPGTQRQAASREREPSFRTESQATDLLRAGKAAEAREQWKERHAWAAVRGGTAEGSGRAVKGGGRRDLEHSGAGQQEGPTTSVE